MDTISNYDDLYGKSVVGSDGENIGKLDALYVAPGQQMPSLGTVSTGFFGMRTSFFPLKGARLEDDDIVIPFTKDKVKEAPNIDPDAEVNDDESQKLYDYYNLGSVPSGATSDSREGDAAATDSMTLAEEEVNVGTRRVETGRYRLKKYVVTDHVTKTVPVQREEVRVVREPIDGDEDAEIGEDVQEITTHADVPVVEKKTVARERVGLTTDVVNDEETVDTDVRRERVSVDRDTDEDRS